MLYKVRVHSIMRNHWQRFLERAAEYVIVFGRTKGTSQLWGLMLIIFTFVLHLQRRMVYFWI